MSLGRYRARSVMKGGGKFYLRELSPTATTPFTDLGWLKGTNPADAADMINLTDERGLLVDSLVGNRVLACTLRLMQLGADEIGLLRNAEGKVYEGYYVVPVGTEYQEWSFPLVRLNPSVNIDFAVGEKVLPVVMHVLAVKAAMTRAPVAYNIAVDQAYVVCQNSAAQGAPSDAAATVFSTLY